MRSLLAVVAIACVAAAARAQEDAAQQDTSMAQLVQALANPDATQLLAAEAGRQG
jgi:hypothetical protein